MSPLTKKQIETLNKIQYCAIRIALGAMKSTPTNALLVEAAEPPYNLRARWAASKYILKIISTENIIVNTLYNILTYHYTVKKYPGNQLPLILLCFDNIISSNLQVKMFPKSTCYLTPYWPQMFRPNIMFNLLGISKNALPDPIQINIELQYLFV